MTENKKKSITGLWMGFAEDFLDYFEMKAKLEEKLGRVLTDNEAHDLMVEFQKDRQYIEKIILDKDKEDLKAILSEHFIVYDPTKRKDKKRGGNHE
jgi:hypothetical protein